MSSGSIDIEEFENTDADELEGEPIPSGSCAFSPTTTTVRGRSTIADRLDIDADATSAILSRLKNRGLVRHKRPYWAITDDDERLRSASQLHRCHETATEQYGEADLDTPQTDAMERVQ